MDDVGEPSRLCRDIQNLESDFRYNLTLLKVRDAEIERCNQTNQRLHEMLRLKLTEIGELNFRHGNLKSAFQKSEYELEEQRTTVLRLTENFNEATRRFQAKLDENGAIFKKKEAQLEKVYLEVLRREKEDYSERIEAAEKRLEKEIGTTSKAKNGIQKLIDENMSLRNEIRQLESKYASETYFYKNESSRLQSANSNLNSEIGCLKEKYSTVGVNFDKIKSENATLQSELCNTGKEISNLIKQNKEVLWENNKLSLEVQQLENVCKELTANNETLTRQKNQLEAENVELKSAAQSSENCCNIPEHNDFPMLVQQNEVLRDLVKSMRAERETFIKEIEVKEGRLEKLELLMQLLKERAFESSS